MVRSYVTDEIIVPDYIQYNYSKDILNSPKSSTENNGMYDKKGIKLNVRSNLSIDHKKACKQYVYRLFYER